MNSEMKVYARADDGIQRVQCVRFDDWKQLEFLSLKGNPKALGCFADIYQNYHVPACPYIFDQMVMFRLPEDLWGRVRKVACLDCCTGDDSTDSSRVDSSCTDRNCADGCCEDCHFTDGRCANGTCEDVFYKSGYYEDEKYGCVENPITIVSILFSKGVRIKKGKPHFKDKKVEKIWKLLEERGCIRIIRGKLPTTSIIPVSNFNGYLSECETEAVMKVNASFFIMDKFDCATVFDHIGAPLGLCIQDGIVTNPPLYNREAFLVKKDGTIIIRELDIRDVEIEINGKCYRHGKGATIYTRPERLKTPNDKCRKVVVVGRKVVAVKDSGSIVIPASGFVISIENDMILEIDKNIRIQAKVWDSESNGEDVKINPGDEVSYLGFSDVQFGIQVGNSIVRDGVPTERFISRFYNIFHLEPVPFPPSLYPMNFEKAKAARIALGSDKDGKPMLLWAEGAAKQGHKPGVDSTGASLSEMAEIARDFGMVNGVNLDGGGSAQILLKNQRTLRISDRKKSDYTEQERLVPLGLVVR